MRDRIIIALIIFSLMGLGIRLFYLQVISYDEFRQKVLDNVTRETSVESARGTIYDRNGVVLAESRTVERVFISPFDIDNEAERNLVSEKLSSILGVDYDEVYEKAGKVKRKDETIKKNVEKEEADKVRQFIAEYNLDCVHLVTSTKRYYPYGNLLSHTLGFVGSDGQGLYGVEYQYDKYLTGTDGKIISAKNGLGMDMPYKYESFVDSVDGNDVYLTIDYNLQRILENYLEQALTESNAQNRATAVLMDPNTGEILAMATKPDFNCNDPYTLDSASQKKLDESGLKEGSTEYKSEKTKLLMQMWTNKAINDLYEPGSTFKTVTCSVALEENVVTQSTPYFCPGFNIVEGYGKIRCHKTSGHGSVTFAEGLQKSCNPVMMKTAEKIGREKFYGYFEAFGYKELTGVDLPGEALTYCHKYENFKTTELAVYSFGQTFKTTAIRQITSVSATANGGYLVTPYVVKYIKDADGKTVLENKPKILRQVVSEDSSAQIMDILEKGVTNGIGAVNAYVPGYKVAAKTGTSEKKDKLGPDGTYSLRVGSCVTVAPADDPQVALIVIVDEPDKSVTRIEGSFVAAPYNSKIFSEVLPYLGIEPEYSQKDLEGTPVLVPSCLNTTVSEAKKQLSSLGLSAEIIGEGTTVISQVPKAGATLTPSNGKILLYTEIEPEEETVTVPDLIRLTAKEVNKKITDLGLNICITGNSTDKNSVVYSQYPSAGTVVSRGSVVTVGFRCEGEENTE